MSATVTCDDADAAQTVQIIARRLTGLGFNADPTRMSATQFHRFLAPRPRRGGSSRPALGRNFVVVRETWRVTDDPAKTRPKEEVLCTGRSAAEAADVGRAFAVGFSRHGFHKSTRRWWASDGTYFHRYSVRPARRGWSALLASFGLRAAPPVPRPKWIAALGQSWVSPITPSGA
jgi:hypothetical protein